MNRKMREIDFQNTIKYYRWHLSTYRLVLEAIEKYKHHQRIGKRVVDGIKEELVKSSSTFHVYLLKEEWVSNKLIVSDHLAFDAEMQRSAFTGRAELRIYTQEHSGENELPFEWYTYMKKSLEDLIQNTGATLEKLEYEEAIHLKLKAIQNRLIMGINKAKADAATKTKYSSFSTETKLMFPVLFMDIDLNE